MPDSGARRRADLLREAAARLAAARVEDPRDRAELLWCRASGETRTEMLSGDGTAVAPEARQRFRDWVERHAGGEPLAYLEGSCGFYGHEFQVDARVLVPRADSESVVECALEYLPESATGMMADLGTGSGCLLLSILAARPGMHGLGTDRSRGALEVARQNAQSLGLAARTSWLQAEWLDGLRGPLHWIVTNPPYVEPGEPLGAGVAEFEPHLALFTPPGQPLHAYERILNRARSVLLPSGTLIVEVGFQRADQVAELAARCGWQELARRKDLGGIERALAFRSPSAC